MSVSEPPTIVEDTGDLPEPPESQIKISIFLSLLILTVFVLPAVGLGEHHEHRYGLIVSSVIFCSGASIAWRRRRLFFSSALVASIAVGTRLYALWVPGHFWILFSEMAMIAGILIICWTLLLQIFRNEGQVTRISIQAAIAVYLLFGNAWANAYLITEQQNPNSFKSTVSLSASSPEEWLYYSFVTLTTLGYGEITPQSQVARSLAIGEALTGQLYLAVLVARLIGKEMSSAQTIDLRSFIARKRKNGFL
jgi:hypothetical protein